MARKPLGELREVLGDAKEINDYFPELKQEGQNYCHACWSSPEAFGKHVASLDKNQAWEQAGWDQGSTKFYGTATMEEATQLSVDGWKEGAAQAIRVRDRILAANPLAKTGVKYGIAGTTPSVPRAVAGDILNMRLPETSKSKRRPVITLISNMAALCYVDNKCISNRAAVVAALVDQIEAAGFACEVIATAFGGGRNEFIKATSVIAKRSDQPVDMPRLSFALGHASMFRRFVFAHLGSHAPMRDWLGHGLGYTKEVQVEGLNEKDVYYLPSANEKPQYFKTEEVSLDKGLKFLIAALVAQRCPAFDLSKYKFKEWEDMLAEFEKEQAEEDDYDPWDDED